ncbi:MAG: hypothetical protein FWD71_14805 [Oscillospiraceae bacterium]|nr:hypothetical protein [Oscillospiraceae bacterium]
MRKIKSKILAVIISFAAVFSIFSGSIVNKAYAVSLNNTDSAENLNDFCVVVDYYSEAIRIISRDEPLIAQGKGYIEISDNTGDYIYPGYNGEGKSDFIKDISSMTENNKYMYALKAVPDATLDSYVNSGKTDKKISVLMNEKWYPIYGGGFNISAVIPARAVNDPKRQYYIAIRRADDYFNSESGYETRVAVPVKPRFNDKNLNKFLQYDASNERIVLDQNYSQYSTLSVIYRFDNFAPVNGILSKASGIYGSTGSIDVSGKYFALGGYVYISTMPFKDDSDNVVYARSKEIKFRIPKVPNLPAVKADLTNKRISSLKKDILEWSIDGISWTTYTRTETAVLFKDVFSIFPGLQGYGTDTDGNYVLYFRTKAVDMKSPASLPKKILIPSMYLNV